MIQKIIRKIQSGSPPDRHDLLELFGITGQDELVSLVETACDIRNQYHPHIKLTSTIHITNQCAVTPKCKYCGFAAGTSENGYYSPFYKTGEEIVQAARIIEQSGIPRVSCSGAHGHQGTHAVTAARIVKENTSLELIINVGTDITADTLDEIAAVDTETVCCNLETTNESLFSYLKPGETLRQRIATCELISSKGIELSSGLLIGVGESSLDRIRHLQFLRSFSTLGEIPIMGFNPYLGTPMENHPACSILEQMKTIAITRILYPEIRITVPTPTIGPDNVKFSLAAGADNLATVIPDSYPLQIKGVGSPVYGTLRGVLGAIKEMGLVSEFRELPGSDRPFLTRRLKPAIPVPGLRPGSELFTD